MAVRGAVGGGTTRHGDGLTTARSETLLVIRDNLLAGLDRVAEARRDGTYDTPGPKGEAPPRESGCLTLALLGVVNATLVGRGYETVFREM